MLKIKNLYKRYGDNPILNGLSFDLDEGGFIAITGKSGAGKSTLINLILGHEDPDAGRIEFLGNSVFEMNDKKRQEMRRKLGVVFQDFKLLDKRSVYENIAFSLEISGVHKSKIQDRVHEVLNIVDLLDKADFFPHMLSGGEQQRTSIARALVHNPVLLLADEPTGNLDPENTKKLADIFKKINELGTTILLSTHNKDFLNLLNIRVIRLEDGVIKWDKANVDYFGMEKGLN